MGFVDSKPTLQEVKDSFGDAAALLLSYCRKDVEGVQAIVNSSNIYPLFSGLLAVAGMVALRAWDEDTEEILIDLVRHLASLPDENWQQIIGHTTTVSVNSIIEGES